MITLLLLLGALCVTAIGVTVYQLKHAPEGHEDGEGFHYAPEFSPRRNGRAAVRVSDQVTAAHAATRHLPAM